MIIIGEIDVDCANCTNGGRFTTLRPPSKPLRFENDRYSERKEEFSENGEKEDPQKESKNDFERIPGLSEFYMTDERALTNRAF